MEQLRLRLAEQKDTEQLLAAEREAADYRFVANQPPYGMPADYQIGLIREKINHPDTMNGLYVIETADNRVVAGFSLGHAFARNSFADLEFTMRREERERYGQAALRLAADYAFHELNIRKLNIQVKSGVAADTTFFYQAGFRRELTLREHYYRQGSYETIYKLGLLRGDDTGAGAEQAGAVDGDSVRAMAENGGQKLAWANGGLDAEAAVSPDEDHLLHSTVSPIKQLLTGEGVDLLPVTAADAEKLYESNLTSDEKLYGFLSAAAPAEREFFLQRASRKNDWASFKESVSFGIKTKDGGIIGTISGMFIDTRNRNMMLGLGISAPTERGKGYGRQAIELFVDFAFLEMNMHRVYLGCFTFNEKAARLYERIGFRPEGVNRSFVYRNGNYYDEFTFGVTKKEWLTLRGYL